MKNILLSIWILLSLTSAAGLEYQSLTVPNARHENIADDQCSDDEQSHDSEQLLQIDKALSNSINIPFAADVADKLELPVISITRQKIHREYHLCQSEFYRILFRSIISPNAP